MGNSDPVLKCHKKFAIFPLQQSSQLTLLSVYISLHVSVVADDGNSCVVFISVANVIHSVTVV